MPCLSKKNLNCHNWEENLEASYVFTSIKNVCFMHAWGGVCAHTCMCVNICMCVHVCVHVHMCAYMCVHCVILCGLVSLYLSMCVYNPLLDT